MNEARESSLLATVSDNTLAVLLQLVYKTSKQHCATDKVSCITIKY